MVHNLGAAFAWKKNIWNEKSVLQISTLSTKYLQEHDY